MTRIEFLLFFLTYKFKKNTTCGQIIHEAKKLYKISFNIYLNKSQNNVREL